MVEHALGEKRMGWCSRVTFVLAVATGGLGAQAGSAPEEALRSLAELGGDAYVVWRDAVLGDEALLRQVLAVQPRTQEEGWAQRMLQGRATNRDLYKRSDDIFRSMEISYYAGRRRGKGQPSPNMGSRSPDTGPLRVPWAMEYLWKFPTVVNREWRKHLAFEVMGNFGDKSDAIFVIEQARFHESEAMIDYAVDIALTLGGQEAYQEIRRRAAGQGAEAAK